MEIIREQVTLAELSKKFDVNHEVIARWKAELLANISVLFEKSYKPEEPDVDTQELYAQMSQIRVEKGIYLRKASGNLGLAGRACLVSYRTKTISIRRQCELRTVNSSRLYYKSVGENPENIKMMETRNKHLIAHPTEGVSHTRNT